MSRIKRWHTGTYDDFEFHTVIGGNKPFAFPLLTRIFKYEEMMSHYDNMDHYNLVTIIFSNKVINANGVRDSREVEFIKEFYRKFFDDKKTESAIFLLKQYVKHPDVNLFYNELLVEANENLARPFKTQLVYYLLELADSDGNIEHIELNEIYKIALRIGISKKELNQISALYISGYIPFPDKRHNRNSSSNYDKYGNSSKGKSRTKKKSKRTKRKVLSSSYKLRLSLQVLGLNLNVTIPQIKAAYRKLVKENHPDRFATMGEFHVKKATEKLIRINNAYEYVQKIKRFS